MSLLEKVVKGRLSRAIFMIIYGVDGIGKSTFAAGAPGVIFVGPEEGTDNLDVARAPKISSWEEFLSYVKALISDEHSYKTLAVDSLDHLEQLLHAHICKLYNVASVELAAGGYGKGYKEELTHWNGLISLFEQLRDKRKMNVVLIAHSQVTQFNDPSTEVPYSRYELKLHESNNVGIRSLFRERVDMVLFANYLTFSKGEGKQARGLSENQRYLFTERDAAHDAKNRFGLPKQLPFPKHGAWDVVMKAIEDARPATSAELVAKIGALLPLIKDPAIAAKVKEEMLSADEIRLGKVLARVEAITK